MFFRSSWRYEERAYRRILLDTGHALGNLECYAPNEHLLVYPVSGFCDAAVNSVLFLDPKDEGVLMVCALARRRDMEGVTVRKSSVYPSGIVATSPSSSTQVSVNQPCTLPTARPSNRNMPGTNCRARLTSPIPETRTILPMR